MEQVLLKKKRKADDIKFVMDTLFDNPNFEGFSVKDLQIFLAMFYTNGKDINSYQISQIEDRAREIYQLII